MTGAGLAYYPRLAAVGSESGLRIGSGDRVAINALPDPARHWPWRKVEYPSPSHIGGEHTYHI